MHNLVIMYVAFRLRSFCTLLFWNTVEQYYTMQVLASVLMTITAYIVC